MKTYQDLQEAIAKGEKELMSFIISAINEYKSSDMYHMAYDADQYMRKKNTFIINLSNAVDDTNTYKCVSGFFPQFVIEQNQYLLANGVTFTKPNTKKILGGEKLDRALQSIGEYSLWGAVGYGFYHKDRSGKTTIDKFRATEFVPLLNEENGGLSAGIRFWQIDNKPLRATLYELDGYTDYIRRKGEEMTELVPKKTYKQIARHSDIDGTEIYDGGNYPAFPIVPLWGNPEHQSELVGIKTQIDLYDIIKSGFAKDITEAARIYWTISNAGGMDKDDLMEFIKQLKDIKAANTNENTTIQSHSLDVPYQSCEVYLDRLKNDMRNDFMALNIDGIAAGNNTATAIRAAYEPLNNKTDRYEYCVIDFIQGILEVAGIEDTPSFERSVIINTEEDTNTVISAYGTGIIDRKAAIDHLSWLTSDEKEDLLKRIAEEELGRYDEDVEADEIAAEEIDTQQAVEKAEQVANKQLNGAQTQSLISIISQYASGALTIGQAVNIISVSIGITKEEAKAIIEGVE